MIVDTREENNKLILQLGESRLDASIAVDFKNELFSKIEDGHSRLVLGMSNVEFVDSSGLGALVSALKKIGSQGELNVSGVNPAVLTVFKMTRLNKVFSIYDNTDDAIAA